MNMEALFLFLILLLGLFLCSFLGGNYGYEGFETTNNRPMNRSMNRPNMNSGAATPSDVQGDNYNHYSSSSTSLQPGAVYVNEQGNKAEVIQNADGTQSLQIMLPNGNTILFNRTQGERKDTLTTSTTEGYSDMNGNFVLFDGPNGETAMIVRRENGEVIIQVQINDDIYIYTPYNSLTSTEYYGSTGYHTKTYEGAYGGEAAAVTGPYGNTAYYAEGPYGNAVAGTTSTNPYYGPDNVNVAAATGPAGNTAYYAEGPYGNAVAGTTSNYNYNNSLPPGIPGRMIPPGDEDLYILKSQVVPPVCPRCPAPANVLETIAEFKETQCPPCKPCGRCPEPSFECKKVPNYNVIGNNEIPVPVLNDFSTFGM
jgi:hypothetical protein